MGRANYSRQEEAAYQLRISRERAEKKAKIMNLADKLTMVIIDKIVNEIIRPGPDAEERECYDMAKELRDHAAEISKRVAQVLTTEGGYKFDA